MRGKKIVRRVKESAVVRRLRERRYEAWFSRATVEGFPFRGVYESRAAALRAAPSTRPATYDVPSAADLHAAELSQVALSDYPVMFWLQRLLDESPVVCDFGGHVGTKYRAFASYLRYPAALRWRVSEVPSVAEAGKRLAEAEGDTQLEFTSGFAAADGADVFLGSGVMQYLEEPLWTQLAALRVPPPHVLLNKTPWRDGPPLFTVQNIHVAFVPYQIFSRDEFLGGMAKLGYELVDRWHNLDRASHVPFHPEVKAEHVGLYFRMRS